MHLDQAAIDFARAEGIPLDELYDEVRAAKLDINSIMQKIEAKAIGDGAGDDVLATLKEQLERAAEDARAAGPMFMRETPVNLTRTLELVGIHL